MNSFRTVPLILLCACFTSCAVFRNPGPKITIQEAVRDSVEAMEIAADGAKRNGTNWGLLPAEVTLTYNVTGIREANGKISLGVERPPVTLGGEFGLSQKTETGNQIVMRFTRHGR